MLSGMRKEVEEKRMVSWRIQDIQVPICELYRSLENLIVGGGSSFEGAL